MRLNKALLAAGIAVILLAAMPAVLTGLPALFGLEPVAVPTASMAPEIPAGSMAYISRDRVSEGDVAMFLAMDGRTMVLHRVVDMDDASRTARTKGDANSQADMVRIPYGNIVGKLAGSVPYLGTVCEVASSTAGRICRVMAAGMGCMLLAMSASVAAGKNKNNKFI